jgi:hypothetical protein
LLAAPGPSAGRVGTGEASGLGVGDGVTGVSDGVTGVWVKEGSGVGVGKRVIGVGV